MTEQERIMIKDALNNLFNLEIINADELNLLNGYYLKDERPFNLVRDEIIELANDKNYRNKIITHLSTNKYNQKLIISVIDFRDNDKDLFQLRYSDGTTKIEENHFGKSANEVFELVKQKFSSNPTIVFERLMKDIIDKNSYQDTNTSVGQVQGKQKKLGINPVSHLKLFDDDGFMNTLFFIFLTGLSSGIIMMIILNLITK